MAVGKTILHFTNVHDQGGAFNSDSLNGTPILLKCFPDHCWPYRRRQTELQADFGERGAKMPTTSTDLPTAIRQRCSAHGQKAEMHSDLDPTVTVNVRLVSE